MVIPGDEAQLFTIEGLVAGLIMLTTVFFIVGTASVYTPADVHISDMQTEQLGFDALRVMSTPYIYGAESELGGIVSEIDLGGVNETSAALQFRNSFGELISSGTGATTIVDSFNFSSAVYYVDAGVVVNKSLPDNPENYARRPSVSAGRYLLTEWGGSDSIVRFEVILWRE
ncbi:DUF7288 family protein [Methanoplanus endosymbiosus]|uniref:Uncharacterized protein n=1 Tax=Methanoplanus endosymbiosus TaxID=33865 RepID=A0A9E7TL97_9EURY|nr:hypothetical protein [Methanoplanus endosymbiosus]UUX93599.1 hypothetical protein L6E24_05635 [Methanoplanus endosymbiosus]